MTNEEFEQLKFVVQEVFRAEDAVSDELIPKLKSKEITKDEYVEAVAKKMQENSGV